MSRYYPTSCTALWGSSGGGVAVDLLLKTMNQKLNKIMFYGKPLKQKNWLRYFARHF
jgi:hypothetical protein